MKSDYGVQTFIQKMSDGYTETDLFKQANGNAKDIQKFKDKRFDYLPVIMKEDEVLIKNKAKVACLKFKPLRETSYKKIRSLLNMEATAGIFVSDQGVLWLLESYGKKKIALTIAWCAELKGRLRVEDWNKQFLSFFSNVVEIQGLKNLDFSKLQDASCMFSGLKDLQEVDIDEVSMPNAMNFADMFKNCDSLQMLSTEKLNAKNATNLSGFVSGCKNLIEVDLSGFKGASIFVADRMFSGCRSLQMMNMDDIDWSQLCVASYMFNNAIAPNNEIQIRMNGMTHLSYCKQMFNCSRVRSIELIDSDWDTLCSIGKFNTDELWIKELPLKDTKVNNRIKIMDGCLIHVETRFGRDDEFVFRWPYEIIVVSPKVVSDLEDSEEDQIEQDGADLDSSLEGKHYTRKRGRRKEADIYDYVKDEDVINLVRIFDRSRDITELFL